MLNSFLPQHTPDVAHPLFASVVCLLELLFLLVDPFEVVVFCHNDLGSAIELASKVRDLFFHGFHGFFAPFSPHPCPHGSSFLVFPSVIPEQLPFLPYLSGIVAGVHLVPSVLVAIVIETMFPARDFEVSPSGLSPSRLLWGPVLSSVGFHLLSPVVVVGDTWFSRSPGELWVPD